MQWISVSVHGIGAQEMAVGCTSKRRAEKAFLKVESPRLGGHLESRGEERRSHSRFGRQVAPSAQQSSHGFRGGPPAKLSDVFPEKHVCGELGLGCLLQHGV